MQSVDNEACIDDPLFSASIEPMLMIRLQRVGRKNDPSFRLVLVDSHRAARTGSVLEVLGNYDARKGDPIFHEERVQHWLATGAKPSDTVHNLLLSAKLIEGKKINVLPKKSQPKKEEVKEEPAEQAPAEALASEGSGEEQSGEGGETETVEKKSTDEGTGGVDLTEKAV